MGGKKIHAVIGGFHLMNATDEQLDWTGAEMHDAGVQHLIGAHCTGINALYRLRDAAKLERATAVVGSVASVFTLSEGIAPGLLTR